MVGSISISEQMDLGKAERFYFRDPDGIILEMMQPL